MCLFLSLEFVTDVCSVQALRAIFLWMLMFSRSTRDGLGLFLSFPYNICASIYNNTQTIGLHSTVIQVTTTLCLQLKCQFCQKDKTQTVSQESTPRMDSAPRAEKNLRMFISQFLEHLLITPLLLLFNGKHLQQPKELTAKHLDRFELLGAAVTPSYKASLYLKMGAQRCTQHDRQTLTVCIPL